MVQYITLGLVHWTTKKNKKVLDNEYSKVHNLIPWQTREMLASEVNASLLFNSYLNRYF